MKKPRHALIHGGALALSPRLVPEDNRWELWQGKHHHPGNHHQREDCAGDPGLIHGGGNGSAEAKEGQDASGPDHPVGEWISVDHVSSSAHAVSGVSLALGRCADSQWPPQRFHFGRCS